MPVRIIRDKPEPMSKVDTAWLRMERPTNLMMNTGVMMLDTPLDVARFKRVIEQRFLGFRRFRQKAVDGAGGAYWLDDPDFDLDWHVRACTLPAKAGKAELQALVSHLASTALDHARPLWQFLVVKRFGRGSAVVMRIHHCYADGIALIQVLLSLTDTRLAPEKITALTKVWFKHDRGRVHERLLQPARAGLMQAVHVGERALKKTRALLGDPQQIAYLLREGGEIAREFAHAVSLSDDPPTRFRGALSGDKRVAWAEPFALHEVKAVGSRLGCTVNDILLASVAGALRGYLLDRGDVVDGLVIRVTVPVNLRPLEHAKRLGNQFGLVFLELPIGERNPMRRLEIVANNMRELKRSRQAIVAFGLLAALGMGPAALQGPALELFSRKATAVATNVPGPQMPLFLAGSRIGSQMFWVPQTGSIGMGISILSYDGAVYFGLIVDQKLVPDPDQIISRFAPEFEKLLLITLMGDWDGGITAAGAQALLDHYADAAGTARGKSPARRRRARRRIKAVKGVGTESARFRAKPQTRD
jgi:WS/DGAT/MGAT family acyltransferase